MVRAVGMSGPSGTGPRRSLTLSPRCRSTSRIGSPGGVVYRWHPDRREYCNHAPWTPAACRVAVDRPLRRPEEGQLAMAEIALADVFVELADTLIDDFDVMDFLHVLTQRCVQVLDIAAAGLLLADLQGAL